VTIQIKTLDFEPKRQTFGHVARRLGADKPATRYQEGTFDVQATHNFHYKPLWEPEYWVYDTRKTAVVMEDWYKPLDPRQYYYAAYNIARANMNQAVDRNFQFVEERGLLAKLSDGARAAIQRGLLPMRHLHWGANMNMTEMCQRGYGTAVTAPCIFSAGDHLGMAQIVSRIGLVLDGQTGTSLDAAKATWLQDPAWQGVRQLIEDSFVERDWFHLFVAQTIGINAVLFPLVYRLCEPAWLEAGLTVAMLTEFMNDWQAEETRWSDSVVKTVAAESEANRTLVTDWAAHWIDRAVAAGRPLSAALLDDEGTAAETAGETARGRARALGL
jgi:phenol hydroxylase P1 protein